MTAGESQINPPPILLDPVQCENCGKRTERTDTIMTNDAVDICLECDQEIRKNRGLSP